MATLVYTSPLSLARLLWWYGEDELWPRALDLPPLVVADLAAEFGKLYGGQAPGGAGESGWDVDELGADRARRGLGVPG